MTYLQQLADAGDGDTVPQSSGCFLCDAAKVQPHSDEAEERLVLDVNEHVALMLNRYPYTNGHLLVLPREHLASLSDMSAVQRAALMEMTEVAERLLRLTMHCQGLNVGINLGRCAGAGVPGHLHVHVLPRWSGDTNFMQTVGQVRVVPQALEESFQLLRNGYRQLVNP